jgi:hypothetical protein
MHAKSIGDTAGAVWRALGAKGKVEVKALPKLLDQEASLVLQGVGWLAREHKVEFEGQGAKVLVRLTAHEADVYKKHHAK